MLSSSSLLKIKRYLPEMVGEKREEWTYFLPFVSEEDLLPLLNTTLFIHLGWEILYLTVDQTTLKVFSRVPGIKFELFSTKPSVVSLCVQEVCKQNFHLQNTCHPFDHPWVSPYINISSTWTMISCCRLACNGSLSIDIDTLSRKMT